MSITSFGELPLALPLQRALRDSEYTIPSPIQAEAIPRLIEGRDLRGCAQTGTGKTAAFALPILHRLHENPRRLKRGEVRSLILTPTRELGVQVADSFRKYGKHISIRLAAVYGGVGQGPQVKALQNGLDVLVATPGRLLDLFEQGHINLRNVEVFVLDEADRMLDMGFIHDIRRVVRELPKERQTLFFSATMSPEVNRVAESMLTDEVEINVSSESTRTADNIDHSVCFVRKADKREMLSSLLEREAENNGLTLVFSRTKHGADKLARNLSRDGIRADAIHGNKSQTARQKTLDRFRAGRSRVLVATDVAARGIDVKDISLVINFDPPAEAESYVHRIGRTARAGASGRAIMFCGDEDFDSLRGIEKFLRQEIEVYSGHDLCAGHIAGRYTQTKAAPARQPGGKKRTFRGRRSPQQRNRRPISS